MNDDLKSRNRKAVLNREIRRSLRLTPNAQRKNRLVMRTNGATYCRSVRGAGFAMLCQRTVQMHVTTIHKDMLAGHVSCPRRKQKYYHCGDLVRSSHSFFQRNLAQNCLKLLLTVRKRVEPL